MNKGKQWRKRGFSERRDKVKTVFCNIEMSEHRKHDNPKAASSSGIIGSLSQKANTKKHDAKILKLCHRKESLQAPQIKQQVSFKNRLEKIRENSPLKTLNDLSQTLPTEDHKKGSEKDPEFMWFNGAITAA